MISSHADKKITQPIRIMSRPATRMRKRDQFNQLKLTSIKVIPIEKTEAA